MPWELYKELLLASTDFHFHLSRFWIPRSEGHKAENRVSSLATLWLLTLHPASTIEQGLGSMAWEVWLGKYGLGNMTWEI